MLQIVRTFIGHYARYIAKDERGVTAIEYGLIAALIAVVIIVAVRSTGVALIDIFDAVSKELNAACCS